MSFLEHLKVLFTRISDTVGESVAMTVRHCISNPCLCWCDKKTPTAYELLRFKSTQTERTKTCIIKVYFLFGTANLPVEMHQLLWFWDKHVKHRNRRKLSNTTTKNMQKHTPSWIKNAVWRVGGRCSYQVPLACPWDNWHQSTGKHDFSYCASCLQSTCSRNNMVFICFHGSHEGSQGSQRP